jgi:ribosomal RNA-processing protein 17
MAGVIQLREERKADLERHIREANAFLRPLQEIETESESESEAGSREAERWDGISEPPNVDQRAQYVDEDRYTTVTVEAMDLSKEGLHRAEDELRKRDEDRQGGSGKVTGKGENMNQKRKWTREKPKERQDRPKRKKKFRYESKGERRAARVKDKMRKSKKASARRAA